uniref:Peptidase A1 domain-containing protein n=1 Tax=Oryza glaberrima TaxID=4538 RepID=I1PK77_ORYGL
MISPKGNQYWFGFQDAGIHGYKDMIIFGDMVISNKVVVYDMEKQAIGWTEHNSVEEACGGSEGLSPIGRMHGGL